MTARKRSFFFVFLLIFLLTLIPASAQDSGSTDEYSNIASGGTYHTVKFIVDGDVLLSEMVEQGGLTLPEAPVKEG